MINRVFIITYFGGTIVENRMPILIHHETGEKPQRGGGAKQKYLNYCIKQAEKAGNKVILFGDEANSEWCTSWFDVSSFTSNRWEKFLAHFENLSDYNDEWAKGIFKRFFIFEKYILENDINQFVLLDSDILLYLDVNTYTAFNDYDVATCILKNQDFSVLPKGNELRMVANAGFSYWTRNALSSFLDFCINVYENRKDLIYPKYQAHKKYSLSGGVNEMTLIYLWIKHHKDIRHLNLAIRNGHSTFNSDIRKSYNYFEEEYTVNSKYNIKNVVFKNDTPYLTSLDGELVRAYNLHFIGDSKRLIKDYYYHQNITFKTKCIEFGWLTRTWLGKQKRKLLKS